VKFLCEQCKAKYQIADEKAAGKTVRMKCRKCGHLIEVRAGVVEGSQSSPPAGPGGAGPSGQRPAPPRAPNKPAPPRAAPLAASQPPGRPMAREKSGALAGALKSALQRDDEISAPVDMSDLSPSDEWYVAINGVPVGPIRIAEVRRKAAIGAVTDESLCWQEGLDEWRPLRSFPELAAIVREAFTAGRSSLTPAPPEARASVLPAAPHRESVRPAPPMGAAPRTPAPMARPSHTPSHGPTHGPSHTPLHGPSHPGLAPAAAVARSNVVPITSRLATAEKLAEDADDLTRPFMGQLPFTPGAPIEPAVVPDPFAPPPRPASAVSAGFLGPAGNANAMGPSASAGLGMSAGASGAMAAGHVATASVAPAVAPAGRKSPPWIAIAMIAAAAAFGVTAAIAVFLRPATPPPPVVVQVPGAPATVAATATSTAPSPTSADPTDTPASPTSTSPKGPIAMGGPKSPSTAAATATTAAPTKGPLDLKGIGGSNVAPTDDPGGGGGDTPRVPGQCISGGQVQQVIGLHRVALQRSCWERSASQKPSANVTVSLTIGGDGSAQGVSASGDDPAVATCIANDVRGWKFPAMGCSQPTSIPFHFVRQ
jgi:predicted Zn finger-like uncharacterized protein